MGFGVTELLILFAIVALLFGTKKLRSLGTDLGGAVRGFRSTIKGTEEELNQTSQAFKEDVLMK